MIHYILSTEHNGEVTSFIFLKDRTSFEKAINKAVKNKCCSTTNFYSNDLTYKTPKLVNGVLVYSPHEFLHREKADHLNWSNDIFIMNKTDNCESNYTRIMTRLFLMVFYAILTATIIIGVRDMRAFKIKKDLKTSEKQI